VEYADNAVDVWNEELMLKGINLEDFPTMELEIIRSSVRHLILDAIRDVKTGEVG
jgi:hypothetical protein